MKFQHSILSDIENKISPKTYLEFAVSLLELGFFNPLVFSHENGWFDSKRYSQVVIGFINLISFLYSCGITLDTETYTPAEVESELYRNIMRDADLSESIISYELLESDFATFDLQSAEIPDKCTEDDFVLVKIYLCLKTGAVLNRKSVEQIANRRFTDAGMLTLRKQLENITGKEISKRSDNSYEMR